MSTPRFILVQDPWHAYAARFIKHFHHKYGYRAICVYSDRREFTRQAPAYPVLQSDSVAAVFDASALNTEQFVAHLRGRYDIAAVIPFNEPAVTFATQVSEQLGLSWSQPQILRRFRDKYFLKEYLRRQDASLRLNATRQVASAEDVALARATPEFSRFVLKPNDGFGNRRIGMFDANSSSAEINDYLQHTPGPVLMEEYIDGIEYFVNGQIDADGKISVIGIFEYERIAANGRTNIDHATKRLAYTEPLFASLTAYTEQVMRASGLLRSPFHLELKVDARGPCLIEVAARLPGLSNAFLNSDLHGSAFDWFDVAAHYYVSNAPYGALALDWNHYDSAAIRYVHGIAVHSERIYQLAGVQRVEGLREFVDWVKKPAKGDAVKPTVDCLSMPWSLIIKADNEQQATLVESQIRQLLTWNAQQTVLGRYLSIALNIVKRAIAALLLRIRCVLLPFQQKITTLTAPPASNSTGNLFQRGINAVVRRYQLARFGKRNIELDVTPPENSVVAEQAVKWAEQYLAKPHADLGRKGPICPFVKHTVDIGRYFVSVQPGIDGSSVHALRRVVLNQTAAFLRHSPNVGSKGAFGSLVLVFPNIPDDRLHILDVVHNDLKTSLMERDVMFSPFHKLSDKPSISNPDFKAFRAPFPALVTRHMDVRDIAFLNMNRKAFLHFHSRFAPLFAQGKVSDEFGYVRMYDEARERFGIA